MNNYKNGDDANIEIIFYKPNMRVQNMYLVISYAQSKTDIINRYIKLCYDFAPYILVQSRNIKRKTHAFQINALIRFLATSVYFEHHGFIIRKTICTVSFCMFAGGSVYSNTVFQLLEPYINA
jgi:hypothetical protein